MKNTIVLFFAATLVMPAQHNHHKAEAGKPIELLDGLGSHTHPIATKSALAQKFFDAFLIFTASKEFTRI